MKKGRKFSKGFTLVELLVVLAIIGILIGLAITGIRILQEVNRDTQRKALTRDIQLVIESYSEKNNEYPDSLNIVDNGDNITIEVCGGNRNSCSGVSDREAVNSKANFDPGNSSTHFGCNSANWTTPLPDDQSGLFEYCFNGGGKSYKLLVRLERSVSYDAGNE